MDRDAKSWLRREQDRDGAPLSFHCGHTLTVRYTGNGGIRPTYLCNLLRREALATKDCISFRCDVLDPVISEEVFKALQPAELELALGALRGTGNA
jgi:hypothetical protein